MVDVHIGVDDGLSDIEVACKRLSLVSAVPRGLVSARGEVACKRLSLVSAVPGGLVSARGVGRLQHTHSGGRLHTTIYASLYYYLS